MKIESKDFKKIPRTRIKQQSKIVDISKKKYNRQDNKKMEELKMTFECVDCGKSFEYSNDYVCPECESYNICEIYDFTCEKCGCSWTKDDEEETQCPECGNDD